MLEYAADLHTFYGYGYGFEEYLEIACPTVRDMVKHLEAENGPPVTAYFTHSPEILLHLVAMRAFQDREKITADNYDRMSDRKWKTSKLDPFGSHFTAVYYDNDKVKFFMNENLIELKWCRHGVCKLKDLRSKFNYCFKKKEKRLLLRY